MSEPTTSMKKQIFILSGQSNMSGRGGITQHRRWDNVVPSECGPHPSVLRFTAGSLWEEAQDPLHADIDAGKPCGVGPGMPFANALRAHLPDSTTIGLVPCAVGGTAIREWEKGSHLYEAMIRRAKESAAAEGEIRAVLWYQGESDTESDRTAEAYRVNMEILIRNVRSDLESPSLPFIQVAIASGDAAHIEKVRKAQLGIDMHNVVCVDAKGLPLSNDHLHLSTESHVLLGNMLAQAFISHFLPSPTA